MTVVLSFLFRSDSNADLKRRDEDGFSLKGEVFMLELKLINRFRAKRSQRGLKHKINIQSMLYVYIQ